ncbi:MAG: response regulator [Methanoregula sp.]|nr:response regulator [Methanoregula sp.]
MPAILFVDDNEEILTIGKSFLELSGLLTVDIATSASMAIGKLERGKYDGILSDYHMPVMNGIELLHRVRADFGNIPFILFTNDETPEVCAKARKGGADFCILKSPDPKNQFITLEFMFRYMIELKRTRDTLRNLQEQEKIFLEFSDTALNGGVFFRILSDGYLYRFPERGTYFYAKNRLGAEKPSIISDFTVRHTDDLMQTIDELRILPEQIGESNDMKMRKCPELQEVSQTPVTHEQNERLESNHRKILN